MNIKIVWVMCEYGGRVILRVKDGSEDEDEDEIFPARHIRGMTRCRRFCLAYCRSDVLIKLSLSLTLLM